MGDFVCAVECPVDAVCAHIHTHPDDPLLYIPLGFLVYLPGDNFIGYSTPDVYPRFLVVLI